jgi:hypothetical protein
MLVQFVFQLKLIEISRALRFFLMIYLYVYSISTNECYNLNNIAVLVCKLIKI